MLTITTTVYQLVSRTALVVIFDVNEHLIKLSVNTFTFNLVKSVVRCPVVLTNGTLSILQGSDVVIAF